MENLLYYPDEFIDLRNYYDIDEVAILKPDYDIISKCTYNMINSDEFFQDAPDSICQKSFQNYSYDMLKFIKSLGSNVEILNSNYLLIVSYNIERPDDKKTYSYIGLGDYYE